MINDLLSNNLSEMREALHAALAKKVELALEERKMEIAKNLLNQNCKEDLEESLEEMIFKSLQ